MNVQNMTNARGNKAVNQFLITDDTRKVFQSYKSKIAEYDTVTRKLILYPHWDYSNTTMKFLKTFINDETCFTYDTKAKFYKMATEHEDITFTDLTE